jgi:hypothetical protein
MSRAVKKFNAEKAVIREVPWSFPESYSLVPKPKPRKRHVSEAVPDGKDHGKGAHRMLTSFVDEMMERTRETDTKQVVPVDSKRLPYSAQGAKSDFVEESRKLTDKSVPLVSQELTKADKYRPRQDTDHLQRIRDMAARLERNDGSLVRLRLNSESCDDRTATALAHALPTNKYLQVS